MADKRLDSGALSTFFGSTATMLSAGIQLDEALHMLAQGQGDSRFDAVCGELSLDVMRGEHLSQAMRNSGSFPTYSIDLVELGERSGRMDGVLHDLDLYYDEEDRIFDKIRSSVRYPAALLCIMTIVLAFMVGGILPVFVDTYQNMSGSLTTGSFGSVQLSISIGWIALFITLVCTIVVLVASMACGSTSGRERLMHTLEHLSFSKDAMYQLALSRFTMALATNVSSSVDDEDALERAIDTVDHDALRKKLDRAHDMMVDIESPRSLTQALDECDVFEPLYARMLRIGAHTGDLDAVLERLSGVFFDDASERLDQIIDKIEPFLAAFLTVAVAASLVSVMLPLIGIMRTIG